MDNQKFEIEGMDALLNSMDELPASLQEKIISRVLFKAGKKFIVDELRSALSYSPRLKKSLRVVGNRRDKLKVTAGVIVTKRIRGAIPPGVLTRYVDGGTVNRTTKKGYNRGAIKGKNEVAPIINSNISPMIKWLQAELGNEINSELDRLLAKNK